MQLDARTSAVESAQFATSPNALLREGAITLSAANVLVVEGHNAKSLESITSFAGNAQCAIAVSKPKVSFYFHHYFGNKNTTQIVSIDYLTNYQLKKWVNPKSDG